MAIIIYHNPSCGTSRNVLASIRNSGEEPKIVEYLKQPLSQAELKALLKEMRADAHVIVRRKNATDALLAALDAAKDDDAVTALLAAHPELIERPIVKTPKGVCLCRPAEKVLEILYSASK